MFAAPAMGPKCIFLAKASSEAASGADQDQIYKLLKGNKALEHHILASVDEAIAASQERRRNVVAQCILIEIGAHSEGALANLSSRWPALETPVIVIGDADASAAAVEALRAGAADYLPKPGLTTARLLGSIDQALTKSQRE
jgi:DNA-binding NtrC family response regulator